MARDDVRDLMSDHARELRLRVDDSHDATGQKDVAPRHREGVRHWVVEDPERPRELRALGRCRHPGTDLLDVVLERLVADEAQRPRGLSCRALTRPDLVPL
jgi:hypothetical protein